MITNYYTLQALVRAWEPDLVGCVLADAFSQERDELTLAFARPEQEWTLRASVRTPSHFIFRNPGYSRARRNVATLFEEAFDCTVTAVRLAERDRMLCVELEAGLCFQFLLFGPRANVFLITGRNRVVEAFQAGAEWEGKEVPAPRAAPRVEAYADFEARWRADRKTTEQAVAAAFPLFDRTLAAEVVHRAGVRTARPADCSEAAMHALFEAAQGVRAELERPAPCIYWEGRFAGTFSLIRLHHRADQREETFASVDEAVRVFVRRMLAQRRFRARYEPLEKALASAEEHHHHQAERMLEELARESRADRYERWGHLLMAAASDVQAGSDRVALPDLFSTQEPVEIPLDPARTAVENAEHYYEKARRTRQARAHAEQRMLQAERTAEEAAALLAQLRAVESLSELERFGQAEAARLARFAGGAVEERDRVPFRRFPLEGGYEVWVGKNARQNDALTFRFARKYDLWMHARGVAGSHAVLRLPHRQARPDRKVLEQAAAIAAHFSKARGSSLVPVVVVPRKYVRKPKGAAPGAVVVEREEVLLVAPRLP